ncbi:hypothetical protein ScPMuIL_018903 [Solemya velum]
MFANQRSGGAVGQIPIKPGENTDELRKRRSKGLHLLHKLSILMMLASLTAIITGICTFAFAGPNLGWPFAWGGTLLPGLIVMVAGMIGFRSLRHSLKEGEIPEKDKVMIIWHQRLISIAITFSCLSLGYAAWCLAICLQEGPGGKSKEQNICLPNKRSNTALAIMNIILSFILGVIAITGSCFFCRYGRSLSCKSRNQTTTCRQTQLTQVQMSAQQSQNQMPPQYPGYGTTLAPQQYSGFGNTEPPPPPQYSDPASFGKPPDYSSLQTDHMASQTSPHCDRNQLSQIGLCRLVSRYTYTSRGNTQGAKYMSTQQHSLRYIEPHFQFYIGSNELRKRRSKGLHLLHKLSILMMLASLTAIITGICTFAFAGPNLGWPFAWGGTLLPGLIVMVAGMIGFRSLRHSLKEGEIPEKDKVMIIWHHRLLRIAIAISCLRLVYAAWCLATRIQAGGTPKEQNICLPNNTAFAILNLIFSFILGAVSITGTYIFCRYGRSWGCKSRNQTTTCRSKQLTQVQMSAQQSQNQMPPQYPEYGTTLAPQQYSGYGNTETQPLPKYSDPAPFGKPPDYSFLQTGFTNTPNKYLCTL